MLDIKFVRENPDVVRQNIRNKFQDAKLPLVDEVIALDLRNREIKKEAACRGCCVRRAHGSTECRGEAG